MTYYMVSYYMVSYYAILRNITFLTFNNVKKNKHLITLDNVKVALGSSLGFGGLEEAR